MNDDIDDEEDYEPSEEEKLLSQKMAELSRKFPTISWVCRLASRHTRLKYLHKLEAPDAILEKEKELVTQALDKLCECLRFEPPNHFFLEENIQHFQEELNGTWTLNAEQKEQDN